MLMRQSHKTISQVSHITIGELSSGGQEQEVQLTWKAHSSYCSCNRGGGGGGLVGKIFLFDPYALAANIIVP